MNIQNLINWSRREFDHLPWRENRSLYGTLVSEIMLQQTTVATVKKKFQPFLKRFPTIEKLAQATEEEVCMEWKGLGYYRRARLLRKAAISIVEDCNGKFPNKTQELKKLSGIGDYTASALVSIGMDLPEVAIDANIERVLARFFGVGEIKGPKLHKEIRVLFENDELIPPGISPREFNEALMDVGRVYCQAKKAECLHCPLQADCVAVALGEATAFPRVDSDKAQSIKHKATLIRVISITKDGKIRGIKRKSGEWLAGQVELPTYVFKCSEEGFSRYPKWNTELTNEKLRLKSTITKYTFENIVIEHDLENFESYELNANEVNFSSVTLKILRSLSLV